MAISFDAALGIHPKALAVRSYRTEILANNLANSETPGFKARDLDFRKVLNDQIDLPNPTELVQTHQRHRAISIANSLPDDQLQYRISSQPSIDGNTVDGYVEQAEFAKNAMQFQASIRFLSSKFKGLLLAIKGQ